MSGPRVLVTVGTDHHRFDRLIGWVDQWATEHDNADLVVQHGTAAAPERGRAVVMLGYDELVSEMAAADVVIAQGGPATIMDARSVGKRPIVIPRIARLDEVVDDHQVTFARWMAGKDLVWLAESEEELRDQIDQAVAGPNRVNIPPEGGASAEVIAAFRRVVDPLVAKRAGLRQRRGGEPRARGHQPPAN